MSAQPGAKTVAAALPWHRRPVRLRDLVVVLTATALIWLAVTLMLLIALRERLQDPASDPWQAAVALRGLPITFSLPDGLLADARLQQQVPARLQLRPQLAVPIDQVLSVRLGGSSSVPAPRGEPVDRAELVDRGAEGQPGDGGQPGSVLLARARIDTVVDVDTRFRVQQSIAVDTLLEAQVQLVSWLAPVPVQVPVKLSVPVDVQVPVKARLPVHIDAPVQARLDAPLRVPVRATLQVRPDVRALLDVRVVGQTGFRVLAPAPTLQALLEQADLRIGRGDVRIGLRDERPGPAQPVSSAGPAASAPTQPAPSQPAPARLASPRPASPRPASPAR